MKAIRSLAGLSNVALGLAPAAALLGTSGAQASLQTQIECQRPATTGEEIFNLKNISAATACPIVRDLGHGEYRPGNITKLYRCVGAGSHTPTLRLAQFEGWRLSLSRVGDFQMSRGRSSFDVIGTDFPLNCS